VRGLTPAAGLLCMACWLLVAPDGRAQVVKCETGDGRTIYTQGACPTGSTPQNLAHRIGGATGSGATGNSTPENGTTGHEAAARTGEGSTPASGQRSSRDDSICNLDLIIGDDSTDDDVRACSRARNLTSAAEWVQADLSENAFHVSSTVVCLQRFDIQFDGVGEHHAIRPTATVRWDVPGGSRFDGYEADEVKGRGFTTFEEAAAAGCAAAIADTRARGGTPH